MRADDPTVPEMDRLPPMAHYAVGFLRRASGASKVPETEAEALQERHMAYLRRLREDGELVTMGPFEGEGELRGLLVFRTGDLGEARELMRNDPLIAGGHLVLDLLRWFAPAGLAASSGASGSTNLTFETD